MFIILLKFSDNKAAAPDFMDEHNQWLRQGFEDNVFMLAGSLQPGIGGGLLARNASKEEIEARVAADPFVAENVVTAEILELSPAKASEQLAFLMD